MSDNVTQQMRRNLGIGVATRAVFEPLAPGALDARPPVPSVTSAELSGPALQGTIGAATACSPIELWAKRMIDVAVASVLLIVLMPLFLVLALVVLLDSPGPVLFRRQVLGVGGRRFDALKLRTMAIDGDALLAGRPELLAQFAAEQKIDGDPRITKSGLWLRHFSLDELPQLWNVLRGDMSLVGPRMISPPELDRYGCQSHVLLSVRPGLTGLWQVSGRSALAPSERVRLDLAYVQQYRLFLDFRLLCRTVPVVLFGRGAQ